MLDTHLNLHNPGHRCIDRGPRYLPSTSSIRVGICYCTLVNVGFCLYEEFTSTLPMSLHAIHTSTSVYS